MEAMQFMNHLKSQREWDIENLGRFEIFSRLNPVELKALVPALAMSSYKRGEVIFHESSGANRAKVLMAGITRITCLNAVRERVTVALLPPGPIFELPMSEFDFRCEAYRDCRVGVLNWKAFDGITLNGGELAREFHQNDLKCYYRLLRRTSSLLDLGLPERVAITMLDLAESFGIEDSRGMLLSISPSHTDIADIAGGASRPRVTECLRRMERNHLLFRQGRTFIVNAEKLSSIFSTKAGSLTARGESL